MHESEASVTPGWYSAGQQRRLDRDRARPAHGIQQRSIRAPIGGHQYPCREGLSKRRSTHCLTVPAQVQERAGAINAHGALIVEHPNDYQLFRARGTVVGILSGVTNDL